MGEAALALLPEAQGDVERLASAPRYRIALEVDETLTTFRGLMHLEYTNLEQVALEALYLRLLPNGGKTYGDGALEVITLEVDGQRLAPILEGGDTILKVPLTQALTPDQSLTLRLTFRGQVPQDFGADEQGYGIYNLSEGVLALSGWYPILAVYDERGWNLDQPSQIGDSVYSDMAFYTVRLCSPPGLIWVSTGVRQKGTFSPQETCQTLVSGPSRDFFLIGSRAFSAINQVVDGVTINSYYYSGDEPAARKALEVAATALEVYNRKFGFYPYTELDVIQAPLRNAAGVEYPGVVLVETGLYEEINERALVTTVAHEVAHQWWYGLVGNDVFDEPWLDEGLTTYSSLLYYEFGMGYAQGYLDYLRQRYQRTRADGLDDIVTRSLAYFESLGDPRIYSDVVYVKAALFFNALRRQIGDTAFFAALQRYYEENKYGIATANDLLGAFEKACGCSLSDFYQNWLYSAETVYP